MRMRSLFIVLAILLAGTAAAQQPDSAAAQAIERATAPRLKNPSQLVDELTDRYPLWLRNEAIGGTARVALRVTEEGKVDSTWIAYSSGLFGLDKAALGTAREAEYEPATRNGARVAVWSQLPLTFRTGDERGPEPEQIRLQNRADLEAAMQARAPAALRSAGIGASVGLGLMVDSAGNAAHIDILETSCLSDADVRAVEIVSKLSFAPSSTSAPRRTYASIHFGRDSVTLRVLGDSRPPRPPSPAEADSAARRIDQLGPGATRPELRNRGEIARTLERYYPADLREAGIGGEALVWFYIDEKGDVAFQQVERSSGECGLDAAALLVADRMRFRPATLRNGTPVAVWVAIPISFSSR